ncbi:hypothetical protein [Nisaea sp.]|uniref:hypothetical protein n=1 Tax=Nisaea sp. TaxID=2024842 RepID=UPI003B52ED97
MRSRLSGGVAALIFSTLVVSGQSARADSHAFDQCGFASKATDFIATEVTPEKFHGAVRSFINYVATWTTEPYLRGYTPDGDYYLSINSGFTYAVDCETPHDSRRLVRVGRFQTGYPVKSIGTRDFRVNGHGEVKRFRLVQTRSGLRLFVLDGLFRLMDRNKVYIFNTYSDPAAFCTNAICGGVARTLSRRSGFAVASLDSVPKDVVGNYDPRCFGATAEIHRIPLDPSGTEIAYKRALIRNCDPTVTDQGMKPVLNGLRAITVGSIEERFFRQTPVTGAFIHLGAEEVARSIPIFVSRIKCRESLELSKKYVFTLGGALSVSAIPVPSIPVKGEGKVDFSYVSDVRVTEKIKEDRAYIYETVSARFGDSAPALFDVQLEAECKAGTPRRIHSFVIELSQGGKEHTVSFDRTELEETAKKNFEQFRRKPWKGTSFNDRTNGRFYIVADIDQYNLWRASIWAATVPNMGDLIRDIGDPAQDGLNPQQRQLAHFFVDLICAVILKQLNEAEFAQLDQPGLIFPTQDRSRIVVID